MRQNIFRALFVLTSSVALFAASAPSFPPDPLEKIPYSVEFITSKNTKNFWAYKKGVIEFIPASTLASLLKAKIHYYPRTSSVVLNLQNKGKLQATEKRKTLSVGNKDVPLPYEVLRLPNSKELLIPLKILAEPKLKTYLGFEIELDEDSLIKISPIAKLELPEIHQETAALKAVFSLPSDAKNYEITFYPEEKNNKTSLILHFPYAALELEPPAKIQNIYTTERDEQEKALNFKFHLPPEVNLSDISVYEQSLPSRKLIIQIGGWLLESKPPQVAIVPKNQPGQATPPPAKGTLRFIAPKTGPKVTTMPKPEISAKAPLPPVSPAQPPMKGPLILIDAGHGGRDRGTISKAGFKEKDLTLAIALKIEEILKRKLPENPITLTRDKDIFLNPENRATIIRKKNPYLVISIHANFARTKNKGGYEIYIPSEIALDPVTMELVARENKSEFKPSQKITTRKIEKMIVKKSEKLARSIAKEMRTDIAKHLRDRGIRRGDFLILRETGVPSVLIETGFLSSPEDEKWLKDEEFQENLAKAVVEGVASYIKQNHPN